MENDEFDKVERPALEQLQSLGWEYVKGEDLSPEKSSERASLKDVVLRGRLISNIQRLNPWISEQNLHKVVNDLTKTQYTNLIEANQSIWTILNQCVSVMQDLGKGNKGQTVHIIDFEKPEDNDFVCTNQFKVAGINQNIIPDITLFVNGLPLAVIECKSPYVTNPMESAIDQLRRYANRRTPENDEGAEKLFHYNAMMVATHRDKAAVGTITSLMEHYLEWKDPYPKTVEEIGAPEASQEVLISGLFDKKNFLDILQNFTVFEPDGGRIIKKIPRYQQFRAVHKTIERLKSGETSRDKSGIVWHTQGSGKSLTMVFLAIKMRRDPELRECKLVFLTDRTQLDGQLTSTFRNAQNETIYHANSVKRLKELLSSDGSEIITAMVQKFQENSEDFEFPELNASDKIVVLADEAHRTQYGALGAAIGVALPNAPRIAFTGTPLIKTQKTTNAFGSYIDTYTIEQAVKDGATVQILYEGREAEIRVTGDSLDGLFDEFFADRSDDEKAEIKKKFGTTQAILEAPQRVRRICMDIIKHYREKIEPNGFKAMIVTSSRNAAITYKQQLDELNGPESAVIISGDHNDEEKYWEFTNGKQHEIQIADFKKPLGNEQKQSNLSFLIVKDMLLTGFDAPIAQVMYLDRKLSDHNLLQAIARVNRTNRNKFRGYIVDYYGLSDYLTEALEMFSTEDVAGALLDLKDNIPLLKNAHTRVLKHFSGTNLNNLDECIILLEDEADRQAFQVDFQKFSKQMDIILPDSAAIPYIKDLKLLGKIAVGARNLFRDEQLNIAGAGEKVKKLIQEHVFSTGVNEKIAPIDLLDADFDEHMRSHKSPRTQAAEIENAIKHHIKINLEEDPEYYKSLSARLEDIIEKHAAKWDEQIQMLLQFRSGIETERQEKAHDLGLTETEFAFYNILQNELFGKIEIGEIPEDEHVQSLVIVRKLVEILEDASSIVDFFKKFDEQKRVKKQIKRMIIKEYSQSLVKPVTERFMELAEIKFK